MQSGRMFRNHIITNGSTYLAETLFSRHPSNEQKIGIILYSRYARATVILKGF